MSFLFSSKKGVFLSLLFAQALNADPFPRGCEVVGFNFEQNCLALNEKGSQTLYLIQNHSDSTIEMERNNASKVFMSPPLHIVMNPMNWSAFASDERLNF